MDDTTRHARFVQCQERAYDAGLRYENAPNPKDREKAYHDVIVWTKITEALRRHT